MRGTPSKMTVRNQPRQRSERRVHFAMQQGRQTEFFKKIEIGIEIGVASDSSTSEVVTRTVGIGCKNVVIFGSLSFDTGSPGYYSPRREIK